MANQTIVALRSELKQLARDLQAIAPGEAGSTFAKGDKAKLKARIAALKSLLEKLDAADAKGPKGRHAE